MKTVDDLKGRNVGVSTVGSVTSWIIREVSRQKGWGFDGIAQVPKEKLIAQRHAAVPLGGHMGTAWDVAWAAVFLASDEARFITGVMLPVDGGQSARVG